VQTVNEDLLGLTVKQRKDLSVRYYDEVVTRRALPVLLCRRNAGVGDAGFGGGTCACGGCGLFGVGGGAVAAAAA